MLDVCLSFIYILCWGCRYLPSEETRALQSSSYSPTLESWLRGFSLPTANAADFEFHVKMLLACNTCLDQVTVIGSERALQSLGSSCCDAMRSTAIHSASSASGSTPPSTSSRKPVAQLTADLVAELAATSCQLPVVLKAIQAGVDGTSAVSFPKAQKLIEFLAQMKVNKSS